MFYTGDYGAWSAVVFFAFHRTFVESSRHHAPYGHIAPTSAMAVAVMFGRFHLTLALSYDTWMYVARCTVAATLFGAALPYILLNLRGGFLITYGVHWGFYAVDITLAHFAFASE